MIFVALANAPNVRGRAELDFRRTTLLRARVRAVFRLQFRPGPHAIQLEAIGSANQRDGASAQPSIVEFQEYVAGHDEVTKGAVLQTERRVGDVDIRESLRHILMRRARGEYRARHRGSVRGTRAVAQIGKRLRD